MMQIALPYEIVRALVYAGVGLLVIHSGNTGFAFFFYTAVYGLAFSQFLLLTLWRIQVLYSPSDDQEETDDERV